jgi:hypothetical protein
MAGGSRVKTILHLIETSGAGRAEPRRSRPASRESPVRVGYLSLEGGLPGDTTAPTGFGDDHNPTTRRTRRRMGLRSEPSMSLFCLHSLRGSHFLSRSHAASRPVVATDVGGNREVVDHQRTGFLVPLRERTPSLHGQLHCSPIKAPQISLVQRRECEFISISAWSGWSASISSCTRMHDWTSCAAAAPAPGF